MAINVQNVERFKFIAHKILPLVYDDSLSYYEFLCKVMQKLNEVIDSVDNQNDILQDFETEIDTWETTTDNKYNAFVANINALFDAFKNGEQAARVAFMNAMVSAYSSASTYAVGDYCQYSNKVYKCNTAIITAEAWNPAHWTEVVFVNDFKTRQTTWETGIQAQQDAFEEDIQEQWDDFFDHYIETLGVVQVEGTSTTDVMSQNAVTNSLSGKFDKTSRADTLEITDLNNMPDNTCITWGSSDNISNTPDNQSAGFVFCFSRENFQKYQIAFGYTSRKMYFRIYSGSWESWKTILDNSNIKQSIGTSNFDIMSQNAVNTAVNTKMPKTEAISILSIASLNDLDLNTSTTWGSSDNVTDIPDSQVAGFAYCYGRLSQKYQIAFGYTSRKMYFRTYSGSWGNWYNLVSSNDNVLTSSNIEQSLGNSESKIVSQYALKYLFDNILQFVDNHTYISNINGITKETERSANVSNNPISIILNSNSNYDTYWFYAKKELSVYFANEDISSVQYVALCVGTNPSKIWETSDTNKYMICSNPIRYRKNENNLPTIDNKLAISSGSIISITVPINSDCKIHIDDKPQIASNFDLDLQQQAGNNTTRAMSQKAVTDFVNDSVNKKTGIVKYETGSFEDATERLLIYIPTKSGYIRYNFNHYEKSSINADTWGIYNAYSVNNSLENAVALTSAGEWECALHLSGRPDFSGGRMHGDEIYSNIYVFIDGQLTQIDEITTNTDFSELRIVEDSTLYDPNDNVTEIASHGREYVFNVEELILNQNVTWKVAETLTSCYMAMFTPAKTVTNTVYTNVSFVPETIPDPVVPKNVEHVTKADIYSSESGFFAEFEITKYPTGLTGGDTWKLTDNSQNPYNKMYYVVCTSGTTNIGERWDTTTHYRLTKAEGTN